MERGAPVSAARRAGQIDGSSSRAQIAAARLANASTMPGASMVPERRLTSAAAPAAPPRRWPDFGLVRDGGDARRPGDRVALQFAEQPLPVPPLEDLEQRARPFTQSEFSRTH
jgi:hypothetical protein